MADRGRRHLARAILGSLFVVAALVNLTPPGRSDHLNVTNTTDFDCFFANGTLAHQLGPFAKVGSQGGPLLPGDPLSYQLFVSTDVNGIANLSHGLEDVLPADFLLGSLVENEPFAGFGLTISCSAPPSGSSGTVTCVTDDPLRGFYGTIDLFGQVAPDALPGLLTNTAVQEATALRGGQPIVCGASATWEVEIISPANVSAEKTVSGRFVPSGEISYLVVLENSGPAAQVDAPGNEFTDVLPAELELDCDATSLVSGGGLLGCGLGTNTVVWNGPIPAGESVMLQIGATIVGGTPGVPIENQGSFVFDADGDGSSESNGTTDDPGTPPQPDPTAFVLGQAVSDVPGLGAIGLIALALLLAVAALPRLGE